MTIPIFGSGQTETYAPIQSDSPIPWRERRWAGSPTDKSFESIIAAAPTRTLNVASINYRNLAPKQTIIWDKVDTFTNGTYQFNIVVDDGIRIYLDNNLIFSSWKNQDRTIYTRTLDISRGSHTLRVEYYNNNDEGDVTVTYKLIREIPVQEPTPPQEPPPPETVPPQQPPTTIDLRSVVKFSATEMSRDYVKGTLQAPEPFNLGVTNTSQTLTVNATFAGVAGVVFEPRTFDLLPGESKVTVISFNAPDLESLNEGLNKINCIVSLAGISVPNAPVPTGGTWYNATIGQYVNEVPPGAIVCPPGGNTFYEFGDEDGSRCIKSYEENTPTTPPPTEPSPPISEPTPPISEPTPAPAPNPEISSPTPFSGGGGGSIQLEGGDDSLFGSSTTFLGR